MGKLRQLKQVDEDWEGTVCLARTWVAPKNEAPYRPWLVLVVNQNGRVMGSKLFEKSPAIDPVWEAMTRAMHRPILGAGRARRPAVIYLDQEKWVQALAPRFEAIGVRCVFRQSLSKLAGALASLGPWLNRGHESLLPGLITLPGMTVPLLEHLYSAAADFYKAAPWRVLNDLHPIEIRYPPDAPARYAIVMGSGGEVYGLSVQDTFADLQWTLQDTTGQHPCQEMSWLGFLYAEAMAMSFDDLDAIARYGWPMPTGNAFPVICRTTPKGDVLSPSRQDLLWLAGALPACVTFFKKHLRHSRGIVFPAERTLDVPILGNTEQVYLRVPAFAPEQGKGNRRRGHATVKREKSAKKQRTRREIIEGSLRKALLEDGPMVKALFEYELEEYIDEFVASKRADGDSYLIAVTERTNDVAMLLLDEDDVVYVNEEARAILKKFWRNSYQRNLERLIPDMAECLDDGYLYHAGVAIKR